MQVSPSSQEASNLLSLCTQPKAMLKILNTEAHNTGYESKLKTYVSFRGSKRAEIANLYHSIPLHGHLGGTFCSQRATPCDTFCILSSHFPFFCFIKKKKLCKILVNIFMMAKTVPSSRHNISYNIYCATMKK